MDIRLVSIYFSSDLLGLVWLIFKICSIIADAIRN